MPRPVSITVLVKLTSDYYNSLWRFKFYLPNYIAVDIPQVNVDNALEHFLYIEWYHCTRAHRLLRKRTTLTNWSKKTSQIMKRTSIMCPLICYTLRTQHLRTYIVYMPKNVYPNPIMMKHHASPIWETFYKINGW